MNEKAIERLGVFAAARKSSLMSQEEMAGKLNISIPTLLSFEKNPGKTPVEMVGAIYHTVGADGKTIIEKYIDDIFLH